MCKHNFTQCFKSAALYIVYSLTRKISTPLGHFIYIQKLMCKNTTGLKMCNGILSVIIKCIFYLSKQYYGIVSVCSMSLPHKYYLPNKS